MSKRFGRNQKRRLKSELLAKNTEIVRLGGYKAQLSGMLRDVAEVLGSSHVAFDPETREVNDLDCPVGVWGNTHYSPYCTEPELADARTIARVVSADPIYVKALRDELSKQVHIRLVSRQGQLGYAISEEALRRTPKEVLAKRLGNEFAAMVLKQLSEIR